MLPQYAFHIARFLYEFWWSIIWHRITLEHGVMPCVTVTLAAGTMAHAYAGSSTVGRLPFLSKLESLASSAVKSAGNTQADLIVVYTATGKCCMLNQA